jgi:hypothetical protein
MFINLTNKDAHEHGKKVGIEARTDTALRSMLDHICPFTWMISVSFKNRIICSESHVFCYVNTHLCTIRLIVLNPS